MTITYIPATIVSTAETFLENGNVVNSSIGQAGTNNNWIVNGVIYLGKSLLGFLATSGETLEPIFVVVAICGFFLIMAGFDKWGYKLTSGSIVGFIGCKICGAIC